MAKKSGRPLVSLLNHEQLDVARGVALGQTLGEVAAVNGLTMPDANALLTEAMEVLNCADKHDLINAFKLTQAQEDVIDLAAAGFTTDQIAETLGAAPATIKVHSRTAFRKLGINSRTETIGVTGARYWSETTPISLTFIQKQILNRITIGRTDPQITAELGLPDTSNEVQFITRDLIGTVNDAIRRRHGAIEARGGNPGPLDDYLISNRTQLAAWYVTNVAKLRGYSEAA